MIYTGACHCGAISVEYETVAPVLLRQDGCGFCSSRGVKSASDPQGRLNIDAGVRLTRYRFGHKTADYLICPRCGTYVAASMDGPDGPVAVVNVVGLDIEGLADLPAVFASLDGESVAARNQRRLERWTPLSLNEPIATAGD